MKVLMLHPPLARRSFSELALVPEPLAELVVGTALQARGHEVRVADLRVASPLERTLADFRPDSAFVSVSPLTHGSLGGVLSELRSRAPEVKVMLLPGAEYGNDHVVLRPEDYCHPQADALTSRYYFRDLIDAAQEVLDRWERGDPLDDVPGLRVQGDAGVWRETGSFSGREGDYGIPDRTLLGSLRGRYVFGGLTDTAYVCTSFGCHYNCRYCTMSKWSGTIYRRELDDIVEELRGLKEERVFLSDFEPLLVPDHMEAIARRLAEEGIRKRFYLMTRSDSVLENLELLELWKSVGLESVFMGLDGHSPDQLKRLNKGNTLDAGAAAVRALEGLGLFVAVGMIVRPDFTRQDFRDVREYVKRLRPPSIGFSVETPIVGTRLFDDTEHQLTTSDWSLFDLQHAVLPTRLPLKSFYREMVKLHLTGFRASTAQAMRQMTLRDRLRGVFTVAPRLLDLWFGYRHHEHPLPPAVQRPILAREKAVAVSEASS